jgi:hypothetical protein
MNAKCPACDHELTDTVDGDETIVWCGYGPCPSEKASDGIRGNDTVANLSKKLIAQLEADPDWQD